MPRKRRIKRFLAKRPKALKEKLASFLEHLAESKWFDFIILSNIAEWIGSQFIAWWKWMLNNFKAQWLIVVPFSLAAILILSNPSIYKEIASIAKEVASSIANTIDDTGISSFVKVFLGSNINFIGLALIFVFVGLIIGFVWTVILESALILSLLTLLVYGIQNLIQGYCKQAKGTNESVKDSVKNKDKGIDENFSNESNEGMERIADETFYGEFCSNMNSLFSGINNFLGSDFLQNNPEIIFTFIFAIFIPMYTYILNRKRIFVVVLNENFFGLKNNKVAFSFSILNNSKRIRIIKRVFLFANNKVTFLIKDYKKDMSTLMPNQVTPLNMESKIFKKEGKFYSVKGKEKMSSAYLCFEMLDGYWGAKLKLKSPINTLILSPYRFKNKFLTSAPKARLSKTLIWNEKKSH